MLSSLGYVEMLVMLLSTQSEQSCFSPNSYICKSTEKAAHLTCIWAPAVMSWLSVSASLECPSICLDVVIQIIHCLVGISPLLILISQVQIPYSFYASHAPLVKEEVHCFSPS